MLSSCCTSCKFLCRIHGDPIVYLLLCHGVSIGWAPTILIEVFLVPDKEIHGNLDSLLAGKRPSETNGSLKGWNWVKLIYPFGWNWVKLLSHHYLVERNVYRKTHQTLVYRKGCLDFRISLNLDGFNSLMTRVSTNHRRLKWPSWVGLVNCYKLLRVIYWTVYISYRYTHAQLFMVYSPGASLGIWLEQRVDLSRGESSMGRSRSFPPSLGAGGRAARRRQERGMVDGRRLLRATMPQGGYQVPQWLGLGWLWGKPETAVSGYIRDYTTQLCGDYNAALPSIPIKTTSIMESKRVFSVAQCLFCRVDGKIPVELVLQVVLKGTVDDQMGLQPASTPAVSVGDTKRKGPK